MTHLKRWSVAVAIACLLPIAGIAQESKVGVVDFERVVVGSASGKKAADQWNAKYAEHQKDLEARQKAIEDQQTKLRTQGNILSETAKADITRDIERKTTELNRLSEDAQKQMEDLRAQLLSPISAIAQQVLQKYSSDNGYTIVIDISNPETNVLHVNEKADITDLIIKQIDALPPAAAAPAPATPAAPRPPAQ